MNALLTLLFVKLIIYNIHLFSSHQPDKKFLYSIHLIQCIATNKLWTVSLFTKTFFCVCGLYFIPKLYSRLEALSFLPFVSDQNPLTVYTSVHQYLSYAICSPGHITQSYHFWTFKLLLLRKAEAIQHWLPKSIAHRTGVLTFLINFQLRRWFLLSVEWELMVGEWGDSVGSSWRHNTILFEVSTKFLCRQQKCWTCLQYLTLRSLPTVWTSQ